MHTHRIGMILQHDETLGKHLHIPNSSGRFHTITSRQGLANLNTTLMEWSTFVLMENHSYVKLIQRCVTQRHRGTQLSLTAWPCEFRR